MGVDPTCVMVSQPYAPGARLLLYSAALGWRELQTVSMCLGIKCTGRQLEIPSTGIVNASHHCVFTVTLRRPTEIWQPVDDAPSRRSIDAG